MMEDSDQIQVVGLGTKCLYLLSPHIILLNLTFNFLFNSVLVLWGRYIHLNNVAYGGQQRKSDHSLLTTDPSVQLHFLLLLLLSFSGEFIQLLVLSFLSNKFHAKKINFLIS